jgi:hypothetical protein
MSAVPTHQAGTASGINNAVARTAGLLAVAVFGVIVTTVFERSLSQRLEALPGLSPEVRDAVLAQRADLAAAQPPVGIDPGLAGQIATAIDWSFVDGFRLAMYGGAAMVLAGAIVAWRMIQGKGRP